MGFQDLGWPKIGGLGVKYENGWCNIDPNVLVYSFGGSYVCAKFGVDQEM